MIAAVAFAAAAWGPVLERRWVGWGVACDHRRRPPLSLLAMYTKPSSAPFVYGHDGPSIWIDPWDVVLDEIPGAEGVASSAAIERGERGVVALAARENDLLYLFFGRGQRNRVKLVPVDGGRVPPDARWLVVPPGVRVVRCGRWSLVAEEEGWSASLRTGDDGPCTTVSSPAQ